jgi:mono/diheme cytochrome c family protein
VWNNLGWSPEEQKNESGWPYQIVALDLVRFVDKFPKIAPPDNASQRVLDGFLAFRTYCVACHAINGEGGEIGPELNAPVNVTEYFKQPHLTNYILNPASIRRGAKMDNFMSKVPDSKTKVARIIDYLEAMKAKKIKSPD